MFRRKRFSEPAASIPWWPSEDPGRSGGHPGVHGGPGGFGPPAPPLAAHDPFGGWPAFGDGYSDGFAAGSAANGAASDGMSGQGHPSNGWPLVETYAGTADPFASTADPFAAPPAFHPPHPAAAHPTNGHPTGHPGSVHQGAAHPGTAYPGSAYQGAVHPGFGVPGTPVPGTPGAGTPVPGTPGAGTPGSGTAVPGTAGAGTPGAGTPDEAGMPDDGLSEGVPDWIPLLTHPIGGQRFQPDLEAAPDPSDRPGPGRPPRRRNGRRPKARRQQGAPIEDLTAATSVTTWIPTVDAAEPGPARSASPDAPGRPRVSAPAPRAPEPLEAPDPAEASSLAGAFAADYLSWDQDNPSRRGQVLAQYLPADVNGDPTLLGWSGRGRQRSEFALPGAVHPDGEGRVLVDVRVRVTPFRQVGPADRVAAPAPEAKLEVAGVPAVAPAPSARGWKSQDSHWVRLTVPVTRDQGRLVVDTWDEQLGEDSGGCDEADPDSGPGTDTDTDDPGTADDADDTADEAADDTAGGTAEDTAEDAAEDTAAGESRGRPTAGKPGNPSGPARARGKR